MLPSNDVQEVLFLVIEENTQKPVVMCWKRCSVLNSGILAQMIKSGCARLVIEPW